MLRYGEKQGEPAFDLPLAMSSCTPLTRQEVDAERFKLVFFEENTGVEDTVYILDLMRLRVGTVEAQCAQNHSEPSPWHVRSTCFPVSDWTQRE